MLVLLFDNYSGASRRGRVLR